MKTIILGLGKSGLAAYDLLEGEDEVLGVDDNEELVKQLRLLGKNVATSAGREPFDRLVISPGVSPSHPLIQRAKTLGVLVIGEVDLAACRMHQPMVAVTGTNGKTTVVMLITHALQSAGLKAEALGNIGNPLSIYAKKPHPDEIAVIELSSYQLETLKGPLFDVGLILNITPDHLDRHGTMEIYAKTKCRLQECLKKEGQLWVHESVAQDFGSLLHTYQTYGKNRDCDFWTDRINLCSEAVALILPKQYRNKGVHESENVLAAWIVCRRLGVAPEAFIRALATFKKPAHRIEKVASLRGVDYVDDSKGTNIDATIKAVAAIDKPVVLIVGGVDKGASYETWKEGFAGKVRHILAIGAAAKKIADDLRPEYWVEMMPSLKEAVIRAEVLSSKGDVVLLSPGCSSFDMFRDYAHRGDEFKKFVHELGR